LESVFFARAYDEYIEMLPGVGLSVCDKEVNVSSTIDALLKRKTHKIESMRDFKVETEARPD